VSLRPAVADRQDPLAPERRCRREAVPDGTRR